MQVILIGSGNIARLMGGILFKNGHTIQQVWSRTPAHAKLLAQALNAVPITDLSAVTPGADIYIVAVADNALPAVASALRVDSQLILHTSGTASRELLQNCSSNYGVCWPIKMVRSFTETLSPATIVIDGNNPEVMEKIKQLALLFSDNIEVADDTKRAKLHLAATFTTNFSNHLFDLTAAYCQKENLRFSDLYPLIDAAVQQLKTQHPRDLQAGPAFRGDTQTIEKHRQLLETEPQMRRIYEVMTESILRSFGH